MAQLLPSVRLEIDWSLVRDTPYSVLGSCCVLNLCLLLVQPRKTGKCLNMSVKMLTGA